MAGKKLQVKLSEEQIRQGSQALGITEQEFIRKVMLDLGRPALAGMKDSASATIEVQDMTILRMLEDPKQP